MSEAYDWAANAKGSYDDGIAALRERLERSKVVIGDATLYNEDCRFILPTLGKVDSIVTDPPYGIGEDGGKHRLPSNRKSHRVLPKMGWDKERPSPDLFKMIIRAAPQCIIWGGNYFADLLPAGRGWLYWDKRMGGDFSDGELAYTTIDMPLRSFAFCNKGAGKEHPTQKPVELMKWCLGFLPDAQIILDPFAGSGSTGVAAVKLGKTFIGIERERKYFDVMCRRIEDAYRQPDMFVEAAKPPEQLNCL